MPVQEFDNCRVRNARLFIAGGLVVQGPISASGGDPGTDSVDNERDLDARPARRAALPG